MGPIRRRVCDDVAMAGFRAGCRTQELHDERTGDKIPLLLFYPALSEESRRAFGPYTVEAAWDSPRAEGKFPLVLISHGTGGSPLVYRTLARFLARSGYVVAAPEHPRNNRNNNELAGTVDILASRPRHLRIAADAAVAEFADSTPPRVAAIGHSLGGYTVLTLAGGRPKCFDWETKDRQEREVEVEHDARIDALVLLAPATVWFRDPGALSSVRIPILMLTGEKDHLAPELHGQLVLRGVGDPSQVDHRVIANAGHFAFTSPFPESMVKPDFEPAKDPEGFNREAFQHEMHRYILAFLRRVL
jgi:predicted dienelactone hydrolase